MRCYVSAALCPCLGNSGHSSEELVVALASSLSVALLLAGGAVALLVVLRQRRRRHRDLLGRVLAPRAGPDTTLLITGRMDGEGMKDS